MGDGLTALLMLLAVVLGAAAVQADQPHVCIVIRTYYAHGTYGDSSLINLLHSLKKQEHNSWTALLSVMDNRPFPDLRHIVRDAADDRIDVFAEWISARHQPKTADGKQWMKDYHAKLYNLTDEAIRACPRGTRWLVVTNGDNDYDPKFLSVLVQQHDAEVVAFDYYSRYQRPTGTPCERFAAGPQLPPCKSNGLSWCQTDLAAVAYSWPRFMADDMRFGVLEQGHGANHDGIMADLVRLRKWKASHVAGRCLVEHAPAPQRCAALGGVWDDTQAATDKDTGGKCLSPGRAEARVQELGSAAEVVEVALSHDTQSFDFNSEVLKLKCIRQSDPAAWKAMVRYFPARCRAAVDADISAATPNGALEPQAASAAVASSRKL
ncbi:hypothetical protein COO60DRAFT_1282230 [Scenedesmus sp. NREL 46B-D3]|nr:hypothetical protein COO60DRAFT_1282230 [Scenedesmus sp. NREL 46B-D3]